MRSSYYGIWAINGRPEYGMPLNIKNSEVHERAKELARITGKSLSDAVAEAIDVALERERHRRQQQVHRREELLMDIAAECARLPVRDSRSEDEILGYDERGVPS